MPFLVSGVDRLRPLLGFNAIQEIILGQRDGMKALSAICNILKGATENENEKSEAVVNFIQRENQANRSEQVSLKVVHNDTVVLPGHSALIKCSVYARFNQFVTLFQL